MRQRHRPEKSRRGTTAVLTALLMTFVASMVAIAVDIGNVCMVQTQAQAVADAAALAGARGLSTSAAQAQSLAIACAQQNTANGKNVTLTDSNIVLGTWNTTTRTLTVLTGSCPVQANVCQVNISLTPATFFARALGINSVTTAPRPPPARRWDVVLCCDRTSSFSQDLAQAISGMQTVLSDLNQYTPTSYLGIVTFNG